MTLWPPDRHKILVYSIKYIYLQLIKAFYLEALCLKNYLNTNLEFIILFVIINLLFFHCLWYPRSFKDLNSKVSLPHTQFRHVNAIN